MKKIDLKKTPLLSFLLDFSLILLIYCIISLSLDDPIKNGVKSAIFLCGAVLSPGIAIVLFFVQKKWIDHLTKVQLYLYSYCIGQGLSIIVYILCVASGFCFNVRIIYFVIFYFASLYIFYIELKNKDIYKSFEDGGKSTKVVVFFSILVFIVAFLLVSCYNKQPSTYSNSFYQDNLFGIGNTIELSMEYPPLNFRAIFQSNYSYHYIYNIQLAVMKLFTRIDAFTLTSYYTQFYTSCFLVMAVYSLIEQLIKHIPCQVAALFLILFTTGYELKTGITYFGHMFFVPNNYDVACANILFCISILVLQMKSRKFNAAYYILAMISFAFALGSKAPLAIIGLVAIFVLALFYIFQNKAYCSAIIYGLSLMLLFVFIYFGILSENASVNVQLAGDTTTNVIYNWGTMQELYRTLTAEIAVPLIREIFMTFITCFISYYPAYILAFIAIILAIIFKNFDKFDVMCVTCLLTGGILVRLITHFGGSQMYFLMGSYPYVAVFGARGIDKIYTAISFNKIDFRKIIATFGVILLCVIGFYNIWFGTNSRTTYDALVKGISVLVRKTENLDLEEDHDSWNANLVTPSEKEAYEWIRINTQQTDVIITNACIAGYSRYSYKTGVFTERHVYIPLDDDMYIIEECFNGNEDYLTWVCEQYGTVYMIQLRNVTPEIEFERSSQTIVFENDEVIIYRLYYGQT